MGTNYIIKKFKKVKIMNKVNNCDCPLAKRGKLFLQTEKFVEVDYESSYRVSIWGVDWVANVIETNYPNRPKSPGRDVGAYTLSFDQLEDLHTTISAAKTILDSIKSDKDAEKKKDLVYAMFRFSVPDYFFENGIEYMSLDSFYKLEDVVSTMFYKSQKDKDCVFVLDFD